MIGCKDGPYNIVVTCYIYLYYLPFSDTSLTYLSRCLLKRLPLSSSLVFSHMPFIFLEHCQCLTIHYGSHISIYGVPATCSKYNKWVPALIYPYHLVFPAVKYTAGFHFFFECQNPLSIWKNLNGIFCIILHYFTKKWKKCNLEQIVLLCKISSRAFSVVLRCFLQPCDFVPRLLS